MTGSDRLPPGLRRAIDGAADSLWLSPISVWELGSLERRGRVELEGGLRAWHARAAAILPCEEAALTVEVAQRSVELDLPHRDPADRMLAATALVHGLTLLTVDERLVTTAGIPTRST